MINQREAPYTYAAGPANGLLREPVDVPSTHDLGQQRTPGTEQPQQTMVASLPGALARSATRPPAPSPFGSVERTVLFAPSSQGSLSSDGSFNASFVDKETKRIRRLGASSSLTKMMDLKGRVRSKTGMIGALNREVTVARAAHGDELGTSSQHDELQGNRCAQMMECDWCCGHYKPIEADGRFRRYWDAAQVVLLLYVAVMVPLRTGFDDRGLMMQPLTTLWWIELMVDLYFSECLNSVMLAPRLVALLYPRTAAEC
eukprot:COSAG02_NODE_1150_length_14208_cov_5.805231_3_plen_258_part_00